MPSILSSRRLSKPYPSQFGYRSSLQRNNGTNAWGAVVLSDPPVPVAPYKDPSHSIRTGLVAIGEIDVTGGDHYVRCDLPDLRHRIRFYLDARSTPAEIAANGIAAILQFVDRAEQGRILGVEFHVPVEIMAVERLNPLGEEAFDGWRCVHGTLIYVRHDYQAAIGSPAHRSSDCRKSAFLTSLDIPVLDS